MFDKRSLHFSKFIIAVGKTDMRRGIDGLSATVRLKYGLDPLEKGTLFLFCGTRRDRIKGLLWTGDRFIMLYIRLVEGRFCWPMTEEEARRISGEQFMRLMDGYSIDPSIGPKRQRKLEDPKRKRKR